MTPIVLFVYARPNHTQRTVESLLKNSEASHSDLIVFSDAAKSADQESSVNAVRDYIARIQGFKSLSIYRRPSNFGLAKSIIEGVTQVLVEHERVIVLEDDMVTSTYFLRYMNEALDRYEEDDRVISVHGYIYPVAEALPEAFFLRGADCWGWATWRRGWALFNPDGQFLLDELKKRKLLKAFDFNGTYPYSRMLRDQIKGRNNSWAIRWYASAFLANKLTLYPGRSLVHNIGNDSSGTHCSTNVAFDAALSSKPISLGELIVEESESGSRVIKQFFRSRHSIYKRVRDNALSAQNQSPIKSFLKDWMPPKLLRLLKSTGGVGITFEGSFSSWQDAQQKTSGYDCQQILKKVLDATLKVKSGKAAFERDSVLFGEIQYSWPIVSGLMTAAAHNKGRLNVLDFGGSLGSSYFQNRKFLEALSDVRWSVVEQPHFVAAGQEYIQDERLIFYHTIEESLKNEKPNVVLLSSVLQYIEDPYVLMDELKNTGVNFLIVDRTPFYSGKDDLLAIQKVPKKIYHASYPLWIFSREKFMKYISLNFGLIAENLSPEGHVKIDSCSFSFNGFIFQGNEV